MDDIKNLKVFQTVYQVKSLTKASEIMGLSKAAISKRITSLEEDLGISLFSRSTRSIVPTKKANDLIIKVNHIIESLERLNEDFQIAKTIQKRKIRMTCNSSMAQRFIGNILQSYQEKNPELEVELIVTDSVLDTIEHNIDISIRVNPPTNSNLIGKKIGNFRVVAVAADSYLKKNTKKIRCVDDLAQHKLFFIEQHIGALNSSSKKLIQNLKQQRNFITNDSPLITQMALSGYGVAIRSWWDVKASVQKKELKLVLPKDYFKIQGDVWILSKKELLDIENIRLFFNYLEENLKINFE